MDAIRVSDVAAARFLVHPFEANRRNLDGQALGTISAHSAGCLACVVDREGDTHETSAEGTESSAQGHDVEYTSCMEALGVVQA